MNLRLKSAKIRCGIEFRLTKKMVKSKWMHLKILKSRIWKLTKLSMRLRMMKAWRWNFLDKEHPMKTLGDIELEFRIRSFGMNWVWWWEMRAEEYYKYRKLGLIYLETWIQRELEVMIFKNWRHSKIRLKRLTYWGWARPNSAQAWARY